MKSHSALTNFVEANGFGFCSAMIGVDESGLVLPGLEAQMQAALSELDMLLEEYGLDNRSVVKTTVYLAQPADVDEAEAIYQGYFTESLPATTTLVATVPAQSGAGPNEIRFAIDAVVSMNQYED